MEKKDEDKMERALSVLNDVQDTLSKEYFEGALYDLKGTLCKFFSRKAEVLIELLKHLHVNKNTKEEC